MSTTLKFKIRTIIENSNADAVQKNLLQDYINTLPEQDLPQLVATFESEPRAVALYADYVRGLQSRTQPLSPQELEDTLTTLFAPLN